MLAQLLSVRQPAKKLPVAGLQVLLLFFGANLRKILKTWIEILKIHIFCVADDKKLSGLTTPIE